MIHESLRTATPTPPPKAALTEFLNDVVEGLSATPKRLSSKYLYDDEGSRLFQKIMALPEYYLTRTEAEILNVHKQAILDIIGDEPFNLVELGAGDGQKTSILIRHFLKRSVEFYFTPIDISEHALLLLANALAKEFPELRFQGIHDEYFSGMQHLNTLFQSEGSFLDNPVHRRNIVLFLGSNIGNFNRADSIDFLKHLRMSMREKDYLLIGFDLKKDVKVLQAAYDDAAGVTRAFNMNLLTRMNRELGAAFDLDMFQHYATYNPMISAMESYLLSKEEQSVWIQMAGRAVYLDAYEPIHTEYSHKYSLHDIQTLASEAGFDVAYHFTDSNGYFVDSLWCVKGATKPNFS